MYKLYLAGWSSKEYQHIYISLFYVKNNTVSGFSLENATRDQLIQYTGIVTITISL